MGDLKMVVVDEGSAQIKLTWFNQDTKKIESHVMQSIIGDEAGTDLAGNFAAGTYQINGSEYYVSNNVNNPITTKREDYQVSNENRVLVNEALRRAGFAGQSVHIVSTLPVGQYFHGSGNRINTDLINRKKENLLSEVVSMNGSTLATIEQCSVAPESVPAWFDAALDSRGEWLGDMDEYNQVLIVDIGGTTTDLSIVDGVGNIIRKHTISYGVFDIVNQLTTALIQANIAKSLPRFCVDSVLRTGTYRNKDCRSLINQSSERLMNRILNKLIELESDSHSFDYILYVGGGAALIGEDLARAYGNRANSHIPDNPDLSVASGLVKYDLARQLEAS